MSSLCVIPARGGSKRIPKKNIKDFLGKPIIAYPIDTAIKSGLFDEVMVSTDDTEIAEVSKKHGGQVPFFRSEKNSDDFSTLSDVVDEVHQCYSSIGKEFDFICCILPTSPLLRESTLIEGFKLLKNSPFDSIRAVVKFSYPIQRAFKLKDNKVEFINPEYKLTRSQDLEPAYHDSGQFYWMKSLPRLKGEKKGAIEISELEAQDIDTLEDWNLAELKYKNLKKDKHAN